MSEELRMDAYYYHFGKTGADCVDLILSAVACAGKAYHHTDCWNDECTAYQGHTGDSPVEWIQNAADKAAAHIEKLEEVAHWAQAVLTALNVGNVQSESPLHLKLREVMIEYRKAICPPEE